MTLLRPSRGSMFPCSLKIKPNVPLFPKSNFPFYFSMFPKIYVLKQIFPCSLEVNGNVPLFPGSKWTCSRVPQNLWETPIVQLDGSYRQVQQLLNSHKPHCR